MKLHAFINFVELAILAEGESKFSGAKHQIAYWNSCCTELNKQDRQGVAFPRLIFDQHQC